jgi:two-component system NtrC family response regulator
MADSRLIEAADLELEEGEPEVVDLDLRAARLRAEHEVVQKAIARSNGRLAHAAKLLGVSRPTLYALMEAHGLGPDPVGAGADSLTDASHDADARTAAPRNMD